MPSSSPTGIVTGAASGIGLAITTHLVSKGWRVVMADMNATVGEAKASSLGPNARFHQTDVSSWDDQAALFKAAWDWSGRLDFFAANAGIDDKEDVFKVWSLDEEPKKPNLKTLDVDLNAVFEGMKLFVHYVRKSEEGKGGKMVVTASMMGIYPFETNPQYSAAKHGIIGLVRSVGPKFRRDDKITVNAILPAFVVTGLAPAGLVDAMPKEHLTPMSTILKAYDSFLESDMSGETVECSGTELYYRKKAEYPNKSQEWLAEDTDGFWKGSYGGKRAGEQKGVANGK